MTRAVPHASLYRFPCSVSMELKIEFVTTVVKGVDEFDGFHRIMF